MAGYTIGLDVQDMSAPVSLNVKQGESGRIINIALTNGGRPYPIPKGAYAVFAGKKPDEKILWNSCTIVDNNIHYEITKQTTAVTGWVPVQIRLYSAGGKLLVTPDFVLIVDAPVTGDEELVTVSQNEVTALTELITEASSLQKEVFWAEYGITTYAEIKAALGEEKDVLCKKTGSPLVLRLHSVEQFVAKFTSFANGKNQIWSVSASDNSWTETYTNYLNKEETEKAIEDSVTCFVATYGETTIAEVYEAFKAGNAVFCQNGSVMLPMVRYYAGSYMAYFEGVHEGQIITYTVQNEAWTETAKELIEQLTVIISGTAASHSASEIIAAIKAEKIVEVNMGTERLQVTAWDESAVTVTCQKAPAPNRTGALLSCNVYTISNDKTVTVVANNAISTKFTAKSGQVVAVANADPSGPTAFEAIDLREEFIATYGTTTFAEIHYAMIANKAVYCKNGNVTLPMTAYSAQRISAEFGGATESGSVVWKVQNATWSSYNAEVGTRGGAFVVNLDLVERDNGEPMLVPDKTFAEIKTAIDEGRDVTAVVTQVGIVLHVLQYDESKVTFAYSFVEKTDLGTSYTTMQAIVQSDGNVVSDIVSENLVTEVSSGVYVGSDDMPDDCNVQIDPSGEALDLNALIDARIKVALGVIENGTY